MALLSQQAKESSVRAIKAMRIRGREEQAKRLQNFVWINYRVKLTIAQAENILALKTKGK